METISVIIPVYNSKDYLENCVASVAEVNSCSETSYVHEIILIDDGSTDGSSLLCDKMALVEDFMDCEIRVIHQKNRGVSAARNVGLQMATGTFILFMDSDDTIDARKLVELMEIVSQNTTIEMIVFGLTFDYYSGERVYRQDIMVPPVEGIKTVKECSKLLFSLFQSNSISPLWNKIIRKSIIEEAGIRLKEDMFLYEDLEFSLRVMAQCNTIYFCQEPVYHYRQMNDGGNAGRRLKRVEHIPELVAKIEDSLDSFDNANEVLLPLYLILAREKLSCAAREEIDALCSDFRVWIDSRALLERIKDDRYSMLLYHGRRRELWQKRRISKMRHKIANTIKKLIGDYRKW